MLINNVFSPKRVLRYAFSYLAISAVGAWAESSCTTQLIVDTDIFSDVEYVMTVPIPRATGSNEVLI